MNSTTIYEADLCLSTGNIKEKSREVTYTDDNELEDYSYIEGQKIYSQTLSSGATAKYLCLLHLNKYIASLIALADELNME